MACKGRRSGCKPRTPGVTDTHRPSFLFVVYLGAGVGRAWLPTQTPWRETLSRNPRKNTRAKHRKVHCTRSNRTDAQFHPARRKLCGEVMGNPSVSLDSSTYLLWPPFGDSKSKRPSKDSDKLFCLQGKIGRGTLCVCILPRLSALRTLIGMAALFFLQSAALHPLALR